MPQVKVKAGIAYFTTQTEAENFRRQWTERDTHWHHYRYSSRVVEYELGFAIQCRRGGDYFGPNGVPSMQEAFNSFDKVTA